jgi:DNA-binding response OmpR family regulator
MDTTPLLIIQPPVKWEELELDSDQLRNIKIEELPPVKLTPAENALFRFLHQRRGSILTRTQLMCKIGLKSKEAIDVHVCYLRAKIERLGYDGRAVIATVWGRGYQFMGDDK